MEAEFGRFFLADYQCAAPEWPSAYAHAEQQQQQQKQQQQQQQSVPLQPPAPLESQPSDAQEELPCSTSCSAQRSHPATTSAALSHNGNLGTGRAEHGVEDGKEIDGATRLEAGTTCLTEQDGGQGSSGQLLTGSGEAPSQPERLKVPEAAQDLATSSRGRCVSFDTDGNAPNDSTRAPTSASSTALTTNRTETQVPSSALTLQNDKEIDAQVQERLDLFFADERLWQLISTEVKKSMKLRATLGQKRELIPGKSLRFRVQVPKPYPGVQYRKSKDLNDKYPRYAKHGSTIVGEVEPDSEWVKVRGMYLPMRLGPVQILELLPETRIDANGRTPSNISEGSAPPIY